MASASSLSPLALTVPVSATVGTNFIRIGTKFNTDPTSCASDYGEFEDYALNVTAACSAPSTQASSLTFSDQASTSQTLSWTRGNGNNVMVVAKAGSSSSDPTNGTSYTANAAYGSGNACGGGYVVYNGTGTSVNVSGLTQGPLIIMIYMNTIQQGPATIKQNLWVVILPDGACLQLPLHLMRLE